MGLRERATENSKVLAKYKHQSAINGAIANHHTIAGHMLLIHTKIRAAMLDKHIPFFKAAFVQQEIKALPGRQLALGMLGINAFLSATQSGTAAFFF